MNACRWVQNLYGQLRGWHRWTIRKQVAEFARWQPQALAELNRQLFQQRVASAIRTFPLYAEKIRHQMGGLPENGAIEPGQLPLWTKSDQRALFSVLIGPPLPGSFVHASGGSTGEPTRFYMTRESFEWRMAVADRGYSWAHAEEGRRSFYVWSTPARELSRMTAWKQKWHHRLQNRDYFDLFHFNNERKKECCKQINRFKPESVVSYSGNLYELAGFVRDHPGGLQWRPQTLVGAAEGLPPGGRELVEKQLGGEVFMSYGSREFMLIGMECEKHCGYHISTDTLYVEVVDDSGQPVKPGDVGRIVVTDLRNEANPFIRYEIGDLGVMANPAICSCGRPFPLLARVEGRCGEYVELPDRTRVTAIFIAHLLKEFMWIHGFQIVQPNNQEITLRLITPEALNRDTVSEVEHLLREKMGAEIRIRFERVNELEKTVSGKTLPIVRLGH